MWYPIDHDLKLQQFDCLLLHAIGQLHAGVPMSLFIELNGISLVNEVVPEHEHLTLELHRQRIVTKQRVVQWHRFVERC